MNISIHDEYLAMYPMFSALIPEDMTRGMAMGQRLFEQQ